MYAVVSIITQPTQNQICSVVNFKNKRKRIPNLIFLCFWSSILAEQQSAKIFINENVFQQKLYAPKKMM